MAVFCVLLFVPIMMQHFVVKKSNIDYEKKNRNALFFFFFFCTILIVFRHESVGIDTRNYIYIFNTFAKIDWSEIEKFSIDIGFSYFNKIVSLFTKDAHVFLVIVAIITMAMIYPTYKRLCLDPSLTIVLFCKMSTFVLLFSGIRQMLAIGIGFIAYEFMRKRKLLLFVLTVILAITVHMSAFMLAFMYPLYYIKITKKFLSIIIPILTIIFVFNRPIFSFLLMIVSLFTRFDGQIVSTGAFTMLFLFSIFLIFAFVVPDDTRLDEETIGLRNFLLFAVILQMFAPLHTLAMRMNYYYIIFIPLLLPKIIACRNERWSQVAIWGRHIMLVFFLVYFFVKAKDGGGLNVFPYHFFWEDI